MLALTNQLPARSAALADRSIAAVAGALFGVVFCSAVAMVTGRVPFSLDPTMLTLYASAIPLSVAGFMVHFAKETPRLPMLATLWFLALFVPGMALSEMFSAGQELHIAGLQLPSQDFVGFRAIVVAVLSGLVFTGIKADGSFGEELAKENAQASKVDWQKRHDEAVRRLAMVDVDLRQQRSEEQRALNAFDHLLGAAATDADADMDEWELLLANEEVAEEMPVGTLIAA